MNERSRDYTRAQECGQRHSGVDYSARYLTKTSTRVYKSTQESMKEYGMNESGREHMS